MARVSEDEQQAYHELTAWTLSRRDAAFIHQHVVDVFAAQHADDETKPIALAFALVGLYLCVEKRWTGRQVQGAHMKLARRKRQWPRFALPAHRGSVTALDVLSASEGPEREAAIRRWCESVWNAFAASRQGIADLLADYGIV